MSNKTKQQIHHHQQGVLKDVVSLPPRYQPPPQPNNPSAGASGILKPQANYPASIVVNGNNNNNNGAGVAPSTTTTGLNHLQIQQQQLLQQKAARLASQVKDAVQSKFAPHPQSNKLALENNTTAAGNLQQQQHIVGGANSAASTSSGSQQSTRAEKLTTGYNLHGKSHLPTAIPQPSQVSCLSTPTTGPAAAAAAAVASSLGLPNVVVTGISSQASNGQQQQQQQQVAAPIRHQRISDDEFLRLGPIEMLKFVRKTESDIARLAAEQHRQIQSLVTELRALKEANQRLSNDNQELRDLCCFLDDDRQKGRKLAREWQRFGRYTASVMRQEVEAYQNKLRQLDNKQQELIKDNLELKELCLYLDEERGGGQRDDGDGSSSSTNADEQAPPATASRLARHAASTFNDQTMQYVRSLEQRVKQLEEDKSLLQARAQQQQQQQNWPQQQQMKNNSNDLWDNNMSNGNDDFHLSGRPEAVVRALQVLEVREKLEREAGHDGEKALVREMCNVVWRKLEEGPTQNRH